jgi:phosphohistidine phosphatase SixA
MTRHRGRFPLAVFAAVLSLLVLTERGAYAETEWINGLRQGGYVQQRQLNDAGRAKAKEIGDAFRKLRIPVGLVQTSAFNRAIESGKLMNVGEVASTTDLSEGGLVVTPIENNRRAQALRKLAATVPAAGTNTVVVTHKPNILDAFGKDLFDVGEGEATVFQPAGGGYKIIVRVKPDEWSKLAQAAPN